MTTNSVLLAPPDANQKKSAEAVTKQIKGHVTEQIKPKAWILLDDGSKFVLAPELLDLLVAAIQARGKGQGLRAVPFSKMITTQQAAEIMGCSRQHVVNLIDQKALKASKIGAHRRISFDDLLSFMKVEDQQREAIMSDIMLQTAEMGGYNT